MKQVYQRRLVLFSTLFTLWFLTHSAVQAQTFRYPLDLSKPVRTTDGADYNDLGPWPYHSGIDLVYQDGTDNLCDNGDHNNCPVYAVADGKASFYPMGRVNPTADNHCMGNVVIIEHDNGLYSLYAHLTTLGKYADGVQIPISLPDGTPVSAGEQIGTVGNSGLARCAGPRGEHLHFELKPWGVIGNTGNGNGGGTPPTPPTATKWGGGDLNPQNLSGYINPNPYLILAINHTGPKIIVATDTRFRVGPSTIYDSFGDVAAGTRFVSFGEYNGWYQVYLPTVASSNQYGPATGWVRGTTVGSGGVIKIVDEVRGPVGVNVRKSASTGSGRIAWVWDDQMYPVIGEVASGTGCSNSWYKIGLPGGFAETEGWVCGDIAIGQCLGVAAIQGNSAQEKSLELSSTQTASLDCGGDLPDLIVESASVSSDSLEPGETFSLSATVRNIGSAQSTTTTLRYYLSTNATISPSDTQLSVDAVPDLPGGDSKTESDAQTAPSDGTYWVGACVDAVGGESDTGNQCSDGVQIVVGGGGGGGGPDLVVDNPAVSDASLTEGETFTASATVRNQGDAQAESTTLRYYLSSNATITTSDIALTTDPVRSLAPGGTSPESDAQTAPTPGTYWIGACADAVSSETNTSNQCSSGVQIVVGSDGGGGGGAPDLIVEDMSVSESSLTEGDSFTASATVRNQGDAQAGSTTLRYYLSSDATITTSDTALTTDFVSSLAPGGTSAESDRQSAPDPGTYWIGACVDSVTDETVTNNQCSAGVQITVSAEPTAPDLVVENPGVSNSSPAVGEVFFIDATVRNRGRGVSDPTTLSFYQSDDSLISTSDLVIWTTNVDPLTRTTISVKVKGLSLSEPGSFWIGACVSSVNDETNTSNQCSEGVPIEVTGSASTFLLSVSKEGQGAVNSSPAGINCGSTCSNSFADGAFVLLSHSASPGWKFNRWEGACSGSEECSVSMTSARTVKAVFTENQETGDQELPGLSTALLKAALDAKKPIPIRNLPFSDNFNRPESSNVGNGWTRLTDGGDVELRNGEVTVTETRNQKSYSGIYRNINFDGDVRVSATIKETNGFGNTPNRYTTGLGVRGNGTILSGYEVFFIRTGDGYNNSQVQLRDGGVIIDSILSTFQFGPELSTEFTFGQDGSVYGTVRQPSDLFTFSFPPRSVSSSGQFIYYEAGKPDVRSSNPLTFQRMDDFSIVETKAIFDGFEGYATSSFPSSNWFVKPGLSGAGTNKQYVSSEQSSSGAKSLRLESSAGLGVDAVRAIESKADTIRLEADVLTTREDSRNASLTIAFDDVGAGVITLYPGGTIGAGGIIDLARYQANVWVRIGMVLDRNKSTYSVFVNGELVGQGFPLGEGLKGNGDVFMLRAQNNLQAGGGSGTGGGTVVYFDNVVME
ncbi:MAG: CARDB domain-containing protein [Pseudomonadota bacterium]